MKLENLRLAMLIVGVLFICTAPVLGAPGSAPSAPTPFSAHAEALPFPPDAREIEFDATFDDIEFTSGSSLPSLADFYRRELPKRGWKEDVSAAEIDEESAELTFQHDQAQVVLELDEQSDGVAVSFDCEGLDFGQTSDPAKLMAAGVPVPRSYLFLQEEIPRPTEVQDVEYGSDACHFKSPLALQAAFDFHVKALQDKGWRESRRPIITADRRYTEFQRGPHEVSVNVFAHEVGSRIILGYESQTKEPLVPPLAEVGALAQSGQKLPAGKAPARVAVEVSKNTGSATFTLNGHKQVFKHAVAYRTVSDGEDKTQLVFSAQPIPYQKLQDLLAKEDSFSFYDIYPGSFPAHLTVSVNGFISFYYHSGGTTLGNSIEEPERDLKVDKERIQGTVKMPQAQESFDDKIQVDFAIDAAILTPHTQLDK
jgi:hypothetical protein